MKEKLQKLLEEATSAIDDSEQLAELQKIKVKYLGKKGELTNILRGMGNLSVNERPVIGELANRIRIQLEDKLQHRDEKLAIAVLNKQIEDERLDVTIPGISTRHGSIHPLTVIVEHIEDFFISMGFTVSEGPEVENDYYNFEALNIPRNHPARDMQDSFYITPEILLRTHTSPVQIRTMELEPGEPVRIICPGKVYRRDDDDATHSHQFMQVEGLVVDKGVTMTQLFYILKSFIQHFFGSKKIRFRPSYFPFTEPSVEVDLFHSDKGWVEILGAGMVHPNILVNVGYDPEKFTGLAFGMGVERIAMLYYGITDVRDFYQNDLRFLGQFKY